MNKKTNKVLVVHSMICLLMAAAWIFLPFIDWKISLCLFFILWGYKIADKYE